MDREIKKNNTVEPEVFDEQGRRVHEGSQACSQDSCGGGEFGEQARKTVITVLGGAVALISGLMMFVVFAVIAVIVAIPMLILSLFGKKPNIKIFKYKI